MSDFDELLQLNSKHDNEIPKNKPNNNIIQSSSCEVRNKQCPIKSTKTIIKHAGNTFNTSRINEIKSNQLDIIELPMHSNDVNRSEKLTKSNSKSTSKSRRETKNDSSRKITKKHIQKHNIENNTKTIDFTLDDVNNFTENLLNDSKMTYNIAHKSTNENKFEQSCLEDSNGSNISNKLSSSSPIINNTKPSCINQNNQNPSNNTPKKNQQNTKKKSIKNEIVNKKNINKNKPLKKESNSLDDSNNQVKEKTKLEKLFHIKNKQCYLKHIPYKGKMTKYDRHLIKTINDPKERRKEYLEEYSKKRK